MGPVAHVQMERVWERPNTGRLYMATVIRLGKEESSRIEDVIARRLHLSQRLLPMADPNGWDWDDSDVENGEGIRGSIASVIAYLVAGHHHHDFEANDNEEEGDDDDIQAVA